MANIDNEHRQDSEVFATTGTLEQATPNEVDVETTTTSTGSAAEGEAESKDGKTAATANAKPVDQPKLVQLGAGTSQPKAFKASNATKKFLQKNAPAAGTPSVASAPKPGTPVSTRPAIAPSSSHSRLVTTKLTATPQASSTTGPGWSRPPSATPTAGTSVPGTPGAVPSVATSTEPQLIQPQPRTTGGLKDAGKVAWGGLKYTGPGVSDVKAHNDFPTAAEVAEGVKIKLADTKEAEAAVAANLQARQEDADTFRGIHLDPNAHHWDEEEDDDNFLDGVLEFGDGRQYKIETTEDAEPKPSSPPAKAASRSRSRGDQAVHQTPGAPVTKEERFADDFDRSWPRSRPSPTLSHKSLNGAPPASAVVSPATTTSPLNESSRVLFNERSNRLEPYGGGARPGYRNGRNGQESPTDSRGPAPASVQLIQKQGGDPGRGRGFNGPLPPSSSFDRNIPRRDSNNSHPQQSPRQERFNPLPSGKDVDNRGRRMNPTMGPPPVPHRANARQPPPHMPLHTPIPSSSSTRTLSRDSARSQQPSARLPPQSPALSHASISPVLAKASAAVVVPAGVDLEEVKKDLMQSAAVRAKQRRQQEEEDREAQKERARQKAAQLEKMDQERKAKELANAPPTIDQSAAEEFITAAVKSVLPESGSDPKLALRRPPSLRGAVPIVTSEASSSRRPSTSSPVTAPSAPPSAATADSSWRQKANPLPPLPTARRGSSSRPTTASFVAPPISALEQSLSEVPDTDLEIVDFAEFGKFAGVPDLPAKETASIPPSPSKQSRPIASDFFDDRPDPVVTPSPSELGPWRSKIVPTPFSSSLTPSKPELPARPDTSFVTKDHTQTLLVAPPTVSPQRTPRSQTFFREPALSALDDAMSRIRGALDVMQSAEKGTSIHPGDHDLSSLKPSSSKLQKDRWVPPALRPRAEPLPTENFTSTVGEVPWSPAPVWSQFVVKLPALSIARDAVPKRQLALLNRPPQFRWDILSFDPPVEGMSRKDFTLNDVLFRRPGFKGKHKYRVAIPRISRLLPPKPFGAVPPLTPKLGGAFGKPTISDGASSWRKAATIVEESDSLEVTTQSPPPETSSDPVVSALSPSNSVLLLRARSQPKMPVGSSVAFYRDSKVVEAAPEDMPLVSFIVTSELGEEGKQPYSSPIAPTEFQFSSIAPYPPVNGIKSKLPSDDLPSLSPSSKSESKNTDDSATPITPPSHHTASWARSSLSMPTKDTSSRGPDPEHLKAVWSQTSDKELARNTVNSLEGIADDLQALPFILQDVKSEDGSTPPPSSSSSVPSRMSLSDVTKAFQQVPASSSSSSHRPTISPPSTTAPVARPTPFPYGMPMPIAGQNMRPAYPGYSSPMMTHSPAPMMYPHPMSGSPVPGRMPLNGQTMYSAPLWVPGPGQSPGGMMRPMGYPAMVPYPAGQYPPTMSPVTPHAQAQMNSRNRTMSSMSTMSPVMSHAHAVPMYGGSPVMVHAHAQPTVRPPAPGRTDSHPTSGQHNPQSAPQQQPQHQQHPNPYAPIHPVAFVRPPTW